MKIKFLILLLCSVFFNISAQTFNNPCNPLESGNIDSDGDGISDICDLDDDNDGILDINECTKNSIQLLAFMNSGSYAPSYSTSVLSATNSTAGTGLNRTLNIANNYQQLSGIEAKNESQAIANNEYVEYTITPSEYVAINKVGYYSMNYPQTVENKKYHYTLRVSTNNFSTNHILHDDKLYVPSQGDLIYPIANDNFYMESGKTYKFRVYFYNLEEGAVTIGHDDFKLIGFVECDTDGDGIPNRLDLDSDSDNCPDAIEGSSGFTSEDLITAISPLVGQNLGNTVDENGIPNIANGGQGVGDSQNSAINSKCEEICTTNVAGKSFNWSYDGGDLTAGDTVTSTVPLQPGTDYGYTFDIYQLDNSFNMIINGVQLATKELNFQEYVDGTQTVIRNIEFLDGSYWGNGSIPHMYQMIGVEDMPLLRVTISPNGTVKLFGGKVSSQYPENQESYQLYPIVFTDNTEFNSIPWNITGTNEITVTQNVIGDTKMKGYGYGRKIVPCFCTKPAATGTPAGYTKVGVSVQQKQSAWPENIPNGWIALESKTKGFVITRVNHVGGTNGTPVNTDAVIEAKEGMLIYDIQDSCVKLFNGEKWNCITQSCNTAEFTLNCSDVSISGDTDGPDVNFSVTIPYANGDGADYAQQIMNSVASMGLSGLTATLSAGTLANGNGTLIISVTGTVDNGGSAFFQFEINGHTCMIMSSITFPAGEV